MDAVCVGVADAVGRGQGRGSIRLAIVWGRQGNASSGWTRPAPAAPGIGGRVTCFLESDRIPPGNMVRCPNKLAN